MTSDDCYICGSQYEGRYRWKGLRFCGHCRGVLKYYWTWRPPRWEQIHYLWDAVRQQYILRSEPIHTPYRRQTIAREEHARYPSEYGSWEAPFRSDLWPYTWQGAWNGTDLQRKR